MKQSIRRVCIFGAGDYHGERRDLCEGAVVIAADGGYAHACSAGLTVSLAIGDFDSLGDIPDSIPVKRYPVEKDDTDMALAVREALALGADEVILFGGMGGRLDHTFANISVLLSLARRGVSAYLVGRECVITVITAPECLQFPVLSEGILSLFSLSEEATVTLTGLQYSLTRGSLTKAVALGVSNHFIKEAAEVTLHEGEVLVMWDATKAPLPTKKRSKSQ
ncbi:MAG: thiamine diphosphokinase [Clostridia bacterium]|nr:thiamine diphosphokinase [Clostridia bacterium]